MNRILITFSPNGAGHCFYTDAIDLRSLGLLTVERITSIDWNSDKQRWEVRNTKNVLLFHAPSREECIQWEHVQFNS